MAFLKMSIETVQQNMKSVLEIIKNYYDLVQARNTTDNKKKLKKIESELEKKKEYILGLLKKSKEIIEEEKKNVSY